MNTQEAKNLVEDLIDEVTELLDNASEVASELRSSGYESAAHDISRGLVADLEMRLNDNHQWLARRSPTLAETIEFIEGTG